ncbi:MAG: hypothetical protein BGO43_15630 [Gammaproteobacteria bacterium 39-13]|nr:class I SAM-dependent methyltransferase [Gammaproteobacteria bacterium]OJV87838.1 MAG: hypothetical protein BGO43_15630 [Gammaproteobacteria bacterium 39-13]
MAKIEFENLLRCPITASELYSLDPSALANLNQRIQDGQIKNQSQEVHRTPLQGALQSTQADLFYPIEDGIYCLLPDLALYGNFSSHDTKEVTQRTKANVKQFYDDFGWKAGEDGVYQDARDSEDLRQVSEEYILRCHLRLNKHLQQGGTFLLDVASGPIQYPAYLTYSEHFTYRVCADISFRALKEAKKKLADKGIYLLCDVTNLPLNAQAMDAVISLHTLYHVPKEEQLKAYDELYRVLKPGGTSVVVYSWGGRSALMNGLLLPIKAYSYLKRKIVSAKSTQVLYFYAHSYRWFQNEIEAKYSAKLYAWRSVNVPFLKTFIHSKLAGRFLLKLIYWLENRAPEVMGRIGAYPLFVAKK